MTKQNNFETVFYASLDVDEADMERGDSAIIGDRDIRLMLRENRIALAKGKSDSFQPAADEDVGMVFYDIPLTCVV